MTLFKHITTHIFLWKILLFLFFHVFEFITHSTHGCMLNIFLCYVWLYIFLYSWWLRLCLWFHFVFNVLSCLNLLCESNYVNWTFYYVFYSIYQSESSIGNYSKTDVAESKEKIVKVSNFCKYRFKSNNFTRKQWNFSDYLKNVHQKFNHHVHLRVELKSEVSFRGGHTKRTFL